jgi:hypothetical protein
MDFCVGEVALREIEKGVQSGKRSLFSKTRPSRVDPFHYVVPTNFLQNKLYFLSPFPSKRATLYIDPHGQVCCFLAAKPGRREKARRVFAFGPFCHTDTHTTYYSKSYTSQSTPIPASLTCKVRDPSVAATTMYTHNFVSKVASCHDCESFVGYEIVLFSVSLQSVAADCQTAC